MKHITKLFVVLICTLFLQSAIAQQAQRMYFVGNSLTDNIKYDGLNALVQSRGNTITIGSQRIPGAPLSWLWDHITGGFTHEPYGLPQNAFAVYTWDILSLQPFDRAIVQPDGLGDQATVAKYYNLIKSKSPDTKVFIYGHWPRTPKNISYTVATKSQFDSIWTDANDHEARMFYQDLTTAVRSDYPATADKIVMVPVGEVMYELNNNPSFLAAMGINSIWGLYIDGIHQGGVGEYITACTYYAMAYHDDPAGLGVPGNFGSIPPAALPYIHQTIKNVIIAKSAYTGITYFGAAPVQSVALNASALELNISKTATLIPFFTPNNAANKNVTWTSSNNAVATVVGGVVTAKTVGTANITVTTNDGGFQSVCTVTVTNSGTAVTGISLNKSTTSILVLANETLVATVSPVGATNQNVAWTSSDPSIATVSAGGLVTGIKKGTTKITATSVNGLFSASATVAVTRVNTAPVAVLKYSPGNNGYAPYKVTFDGRSSYDNDPGDFVLGFDWVVKLKGSNSIIKTEVSNGFDYTFTTAGVYEVTLQAVDNDEKARSLNTESVTITVADMPSVPVAETALCYEGFDYLKMAITDLNGGRGWNGGWAVQDPVGNDATGFAVDNASPLMVSNLRQSGNYMILGHGSEQCGRALDVSSNGAFKDYLTSTAGGAIGKAGTSLWFSAIIRPQNNNKTCNVSFNNSGVSWYGENTSKKLAFGGFGGNYWGFAFGFEAQQVQYLSTVPIVNNVPVFLVAKVDFDATNTVNLYINPAPGNVPTGTLVTGSSTLNLDFRNLGTTFTYDANKMGLDEIRFGKSYADVAPISIPDADAPTTPTGLTTGTISSVSVVLNWNASVNTIGTTTYDIYNGNALVGSTTNTTFTVTGLSASTLYIFTIVAKDGFGTAAATLPLAVTTDAQDTQLPTAPTNLTSGTVTSNSVVLTWTASTDNIGVANYEVYKGVTLVGSPTTNTFTITGLAAGTNYDFQVLAKDAAGNKSDKCLPITVKTNVVAAGTAFRYLRLTALGAVGTYDVYFTEIQWMVGATAYPTTKATGTSAAITATQANNGAWKAYDGVAGPNNAWMPNVTTYPYSITIDLGADVAIAPTAIKIGVDWNGRAMSSFICEGSNDKSDWATLLTKSGLTTDSWIRDTYNTFTINNPSSALSIIDDNKLRIYPNPVLNELNLSVDVAFSKAEISILDLQGRNLITKLIANSGFQSIDVSNLSNGVYLLKVAADGKVLNTKFIKK